MLSFFKRRTSQFTLAISTGNPDLQIRSLLEYPEVRRVMGLDVTEHAEPRQLEQAAA